MKNLFIIMLLITLGNTGNLETMKSFLPEINECLSKKYGPGEEWITCTPGIGKTPSVAYDNAVKSAKYVSKGIQTLETYYTNPSGFMYTTKKGNGDISFLKVDYDKKECIEKNKQWFCGFRTRQIDYANFIYYGEDGKNKRKSIR